MEFGRACTKCGVSKPLTEFFKDSRNKSGLRSSCKDCDKARARSHYERNREQRLTWQKEYYLANQEKAIEYARQWRKDNPDKTREYHRIEGERHPERVKAHHAKKSLRYRTEQPERVNAWDKAWRERNPEKVALKNQRRRIKSKQFVVTAVDIAKIQSKPCLKCNKSVPSTVDHIIPLARGGTHSIGNLQPLCKSCNSSKGKKTMMEWRLGTG